MAIVRLTGKQFEINRPKFSGNNRFPYNTPIYIIGLAKDPKDPSEYKHTPWANSEALVVEIEINGKKKEIPLPLITNCVEMRDGIIHNIGDEELKCVEYYGNRISDKMKFYNLNYENALPEKFICIQRIKRGRTIEDTGPKEAYSSEFFEMIKKNGNGFGGNFPDSFEDYVRASDGLFPQVFIGEDGISNYSSTYIIEPVEWPEH